MEHKGTYKLSNTYMTDLSCIGATCAIEGKPIGIAPTRLLYKGHIFWEDASFSAEVIQFKSGNIKVLCISKEEALVDFLSALSEHMYKRRFFLSFRLFSSYLYKVATCGFLVLLSLSFARGDMRNAIGCILVLMAVRFFYVFCRNKVR